MPVPPEETLQPPPPPYPAPAATPNPGLNTNSGLGPGPGLIIHSPVGVIRWDVLQAQQTVSQGQWTNNEGNWSPPAVFKALGNVNVSGIGDHTLRGLSVGGVTGVLDVLFTTGTAGGSPQHVVALVDQIPAPTVYIAILLDTSNRAYAVVTDANGVIVAQSTPSGAVLPAGITLDATLTWNANTPSVSFTIGETPQVFATNPSVPWVSFPPNWLMVGDGFGSNLAFAGSIGNAQVGNAA
jgi:hypothetical protein